MALHFDSGIRLWCFLIWIIGVGASLSGFYLDNGIDQTIIQREMTHREKAIMEHEILDLLGLPTRPRRTRRMPLNNSAPIFLMDIYKSLAEEHDSVRPTRSSDLVLSGEDLQAIDESDVIMTFQSKSHHGAGMRHEKHRKLWFDVSKVPLDETIINAELRIFKASNYSDLNPRDVFTISVNKIKSIDNQGLELELINARNVSAAKEGWIEINITDTFIDWVAFPSLNNGLYISVHYAIRPEHEVKPEDIGIVSVKGEDKKQPFMVAFFKSSLIINDRVVSRKKREIGSNKRHTYIPESHRNTQLPWMRAPLKSCQIQSLYVSFKDLEWKDWIIAPDGYGAYYCSGECNFPLNSHMNATNHAIVQTLVHLLNPTKVPKPCCAPNKLTPISVLHFVDESSDVVMKKYKNMVVKSCGCH